MIEVLKQMVEALEHELCIDWTNNEEFNASAEKMHDAIQAGKKAIAELESQETVAKLKTSNVLLRCHSCGYSDKLTMQIEYTHPPQRTWVGLTDEEICLFSMWLDSKPDATVFTAIEAKLKEKNS